MIVNMEKNTPAPAHGLISSLAGVARNSVGLLVSRLELAALELSEVRDHLFKMLVVLTMATLAACFSIAYGSLLIVYLTWENLGWKILLIMTLFFAVIAAGLLLYVRTLLMPDKLSLPETMAELRADRDMLL